MTFKVCAKIKSAGNASRKIMSQIMKSHLEILESSLFKKKCKKILVLDIVGPLIKSEVYHLFWRICKTRFQILLGIETLTFQF